MAIALEVNKKQTSTASDHKGNYHREQKITTSQLAQLVYDR